MENKNEISVKINKDGKAMIEKDMLDDPSYADIAGWAKEAISQLQQCNALWLKIDNLIGKEIPTEDTNRLDTQARKYFSRAEALINNISGQLN